MLVIVLQLHVHVCACVCTFIFCISHHCIINQIDSLHSVHVRVCVFVLCFLLSCCISQGIFFVELLMKYWPH